MHARLVYKHCQHTTCTCLSMGHADQFGRRLATIFYLCLSTARLNLWQLAAGERKHVRLYSGCWLLEIAFPQGLQSVESSKAAAAPLPKTLAAWAEQLQTRATVSVIAAKLASVPGLKVAQKFAAAAALRRQCA